jgi:uncharacterized protein YgiM (DUF1202 family)
MRRSAILLVLFVSMLISACGAEPAVSTSQPEAEQPAVLVTQTQPPAADPTGTAAPPASPTETLPPMPDLDDEQFDQQLAQAVQALDFSALRTMMKDRFLIANWQASLTEYASDEALQLLQQGVFSPGAKPAVQFTSDVPALLGGKDPLGEWGPVTRPVRALHVNGLGANGDQEAVLVIGQDTDAGQLFWLGILVVETEAQNVMAKVELNVRLGPGGDYAVVGLMRSGEIAQVTGKSQDGAWWRIYCTNDPSGICWISADPSLSEATTPP